MSTSPHQEGTAPTRESILAQLRATRERDDAARVAAGDLEALADSIGGCFSNVMDLPEWMRVPALGRHMTPLVEIAARAVLASSWLAAHDAQVRREHGERIAQAIEVARDALDPAFSELGGNLPRGYTNAARIARHEADR